MIVGGGSDEEETSEELAGVLLGVCF